MLDWPGHQREHGVEGTRGAIAFPHEGRPVAEEAWDGRGGCRFDGRRREPALDISYELYILTLTVVSIVFAVLSYLYAPIDDRMSRIFWLLDTFTCILFLIDFVRRFKRADEKRAYMRHGGVADLLGSIPAIPALRLFRLFRLVRIVTRLKRLGSKQVRRQVIAQRAQFTLLFAASRRSC